MAEFNVMEESMSEQFQLTIDCDNDAFADNPAPEIARILRAVAEQLSGTDATSGADDYRYRKVRDEMTTSVRYEIQLTAFHHNTYGDDRSPYAPGGHVVSQHRTLSGAERKLKTLKRGTSCTCGCFVVVEREKEVMK